MSDSAVVLCPVRNRPAQAVECLQSFLDTREDRAFGFWFVVDEDDPTDYPGDLIRCPPGPKGMVHPTNYGAEILAAKYDLLMWIGCDHRFRTQAWDRLFRDAMEDLDGVGFVYCNDLLQGASLPTECMISSNIVRALGYMVNPKLQHLYVDNFWLSLGRATGRITYLPDVIIEHMHYSVGKSALDEEYVLTNSSEMNERDRASSQDYMATQFELDVAKVRALAGHPVR